MTRQCIHAGADPHGSSPFSSENTAHIRARTVEPLLIMAPLLDWSSEPTASIADLSGTCYGGGITLNASWPVVHPAHPAMRLGGATAR